MSTSASTVVRAESDSSITSDYGSVDELHPVYGCVKCIYHLKRRCVQPLPARQLLIREVAGFTDAEIKGSICGRTRPFHNVIRKFREDPSKLHLYCAPLTFYVHKNEIRVEIGRGECYCKHFFTVEKQNFYSIIHDTKLKALDIQVDSGAHDMFEFIAFTLPGSWCRELKALNVVFADKDCVAPLSTLLKKSRELSRLRIAHTCNEIITVSSFIKNMGSLEELELNCPDNSGSGFLIDKITMKSIVELDKRCGSTRPFRLLKAFNAHFGFTAKEFIKECSNMSKQTHNQMWPLYDTLDELRGRGGVDLDDPENCINFEISPSIPQALNDQIFEEMCRKSKSYLLQFTANAPTKRYFLIRNSLFRLIDRDYF